ncbi:hypothetical protein [Blastopirellula marina]|uniref:Hydrolase n=1 Tax=Blastopirellula marina TaxID=124 RepID=A0A2S8FF97_9BACT|nr:hypothetical protein [Blastopirellula marina]PQO30817.1 hypothetical protein C5Y98_20695 [Blastopirellula marina]PTL42670.1 hypothetical protein C5Y97_20705 [Blastopirellula marina]
MPVTPFHMGPAVALKAATQGGFSLMVFGWSQILMDLQPLIALTTGRGHVHGFSHTYVGATLLAIIAAISGKYLGEFGLRLFRVFAKGDSIPWRVAILSAAIGCYSHVLLDSVMHADMSPFFPINGANPLLRLVSVRMLHVFCVYSGLVGASVYAWLQLRRRKEATATVPAD